MGDLISDLQQILADDAAVQFHFPFLQSIGDGVGHLEEIEDLLALEAHAFGVGGNEDAESLSGRHS